MISRARLLHVTHNDSRHLTRDGPAKTLEKYKNNLNILGLKYIRPLTDGGFFDDTVSAQTLQEFSEKILGNLKTEVAEKIRNTKIFKPDTEKFKCEKCPYEFLCDGGEDD